LADWLIDCVTLRDPRRCENIEGAGGPETGRWWRTVDQIVQLIRSGSDRFYTRDRYGNAAWVEAVQGRLRWFIRTVADGTTTDNLLSQPACPGH
jgi:hypothetical protein